VTYDQFLSAMKAAGYAVSACGRPVASERHHRVSGHGVYGHLFPPEYCATGRYGGGLVALDNERCFDKVS